MLRSSRQAGGHLDGYGSFPSPYGDFPLTIAQLTIGNGQPVQAVEFAHGV